MLPKKYRNIKRDLFSAIYSRGKRVRGFFGSTTYLLKQIPGKISEVRFAVTPNKEFGDAVNRNLQRRRASNALESIVSTINLEFVQEQLYLKHSKQSLLIVYYLYKQVEAKDIPKLKLEIRKQLDEVFTAVVD
jgi:ribonuclease P protein component